MVAKTYIYTNSEILAQHDGDHTANRYFYLHDRLGSVRMVINAGGAVMNHYIYDPWGLPVGNETQETISNMYRFASKKTDSRYPGIVDSEKAGETRNNLMLLYRDKDKQEKIAQPLERVVFSFTHQHL